jgi:23S rRNA (cytosine1962-C5)-methyltransferase
MFRNRLAKMHRRLGKQAKKLGVGCYRVYDHDLPEFPFLIEIYEEKLSVSEYKRRHGMTDEEHDQWLEHSLDIVGEVLEVPRGNIFLRTRQRKAGRSGQYRKRGEEQHEFVVKENGLKFIVNLSDYLDTGLFLDHRLTRQLVREQSGGKKVLNLFAYTGSFSVYAAAGGATEVRTVDLSKTYLDWARENLRINGFEDEKKYPCIHADVLQYLDRIEQDYFDLIILDPPTFSNSQRMKQVLDIQRDHVGLINRSLAALKKGGTLYFSTNYTKFHLDAEKIAASSISEITKEVRPFDFRKLQASSYKLQDL